MVSDDLPNGQTSERFYPKFPRACVRSAERAICHPHDCIASSFLGVLEVAHHLPHDAVRACVAGKISSTRPGSDEAPIG